MGYKLDQYRATKAVIHLDHLTHNVKELRSAVGGRTFFCPMVKANGYGHGDVAVAQCLATAGVEVMGVGLIEEGILLRQMGVKTALLFFGMFDASGAQALVQYQLIPVLSTWEQVRALELVVKVDYPVHIKFDTGMHRLGFSLTELPKVLSYFQNSKLKVTGILTHLHSGEDAGDTQGSSFEQLGLFQEVERACQVFSPVSHTLNSAGCLHFLSHKGKELPQKISFQQGVRPGLAIYGLSPVTPCPLKLLPVMSLRSQTVKYHWLKAGEGVSYNVTWKAARDSAIAVIPIGYADGYHRALSNKAEILFRGQRVPVVGNVCMDYVMADITQALRQDEVVDSLRPETVTLMGLDESGVEISVSDVAKKAGTIAWEILTSVGERVPRILEDGRHAVQKNDSKEVRP